MDNPRPQLVATVAAVEAKLASIPGIPESVPATTFFADGAPLVATMMMTSGQFFLTTLTDIKS